MREPKLLYLAEAWPAVAWWWGWALAALGREIEWQKQRARLAISSMFEFASIFVSLSLSAIVLFTISALLVFMITKSAFEERVLVEHCLISASGERAAIDGGRLLLPGTAMYEVRAVRYCASLARRQLGISPSREQRNKCFYNESGLAVLYYQRRQWHNSNALFPMLWWWHCRDLPEELPS